jgi:hypothetical protein
VWRIVTLGVSGVWEIAHAAVTRRPPISLHVMVPRTGGYTYGGGVWILSIVQGPSLSPRVKPLSHDSQLFHRWVTLRARWVTRRARWEQAEMRVTVRVVLRRCSTCRRATGSAWPHGLAACTGCTGSCAHPARRLAPRCRLVHPYIIILQHTATHRERSVCESNPLPLCAIQLTLRPTRAGGAYTRRTFPPHPSQQPVMGLPPGWAQAALLWVAGEPRSG